MSKTLVSSNPWQTLRQFTQARIALGRAGNSLPTDEVLNFGLAHAQARDAVHEPLDRDNLLGQLQQAGYPYVAVHSAAVDRTYYLRRPDYGRRLSDESRAALRAIDSSVKPDVVFVIADGLSAIAPVKHAVPLLNAMRRRIGDRVVGPIVVAEQARVALGDEIGELLAASQVVMLIGERPGLSSPDSLGIYLTHAPRLGRSDAERNCISNVRLEGLSYELAAHKLAYLMDGALKLGASGVNLKDDSDHLIAADAATSSAPTLSGTTVG